jgi:ribosome modulation factor
MADVRSQQLPELVHDRRDRSLPIECTSKGLRQGVETHVLEECPNERLTDRREADNGWKKQFLFLAKVSNRLLGEEAQERRRHRLRVGALSGTPKPARLNQRTVMVMRQRYKAAVSFHD